MKRLVESHQPQAQVRTKNVALLTESAGAVKYVVVNENFEQWIITPKTLIMFD